eukprot:GDKH01012243.1.p3 GENE.GDKH01012243.1~~GDKH01012243.1.p3  ORF type:complete len:52 (-),score=0.03 GDKH01012243.1:32-187(-)
MESLKAAQSMCTEAGMVVPPPLRLDTFWEPEVVDGSDIFCTRLLYVRGKAV